MSKPRCWNCKFAGVNFKISDKTHNHCEHPDYAKENEEKPDGVSPWETLRATYDTCEKHEFKTKKP